MHLSLKDYRNKVLGCWMGKNIGGTLGAPFEWIRQVNHVNFYTQKLDGNPLPNDDLDIQLLWLIAMEEKGIELDARLLGEYWLNYVTPYWGEYGTAKVNMRAGLMPPLSGSYNNVYKDSCGAYIRSEIWACITPGCPDAAVKFAYEDAILDHGNGEGIYAEIFCAALESAAFVESDMSKLIVAGLSYIPEDCGIAKAVRHVINAYDSGMTWLEARNDLLDKFRGRAVPGRISVEDAEKGFGDGKHGWDAPGNVGIVVIGMLYGEGDFGKSLCTAVNCGEDTDCTAATVGAILGIIGGIDSISEEWKKPIGEKLVTGTLNIGDLGYYGDQLPKDIHELTKRVEEIAQKVIQHYRLPVSLSDAEKLNGSSDLNGLMCTEEKRAALYKYINCPVYMFYFFNIIVDYCGDPLIRDHEPKAIRLIIENKYKMQERVNICWHIPDGWRISPSVKGSTFVVPEAWQPETPSTFEFVIEAEKVNSYTNRCLAELTIEGKHTVMTVPVVLLNSNI